MSDIDGPRPPPFHRRFRRYDLNLMIALDALLAEDGNVTRTAERLAVSQSAMSHSLARLREMFGDPLFVRAGARMMPTAFVARLRPMIDAWIDRTDGLLVSVEPFNLHQSRARIAASIPEQIERLVMPPLMVHLHDVAPAIEVFVTPQPLGEVLDALNAGTVDLAVAIGPCDFRPWHVVHPVCDTPFVQVFNPCQVGGARPLPVERIAALPHLKVSYEPEKNIAIDSYFESRGLARRVVAGCAGAASVPAMVAARPLVAILPALVARSFVSRPDLAIEPFGDDSLSVAVQIVWHRRSDGDDAHVYVRNRIAHYLLEASV